MADGSVAPPSLARRALSFFVFRRLGRWQWRLVLASLVAAVGGFVVVAYHAFTMKRGAEPPMSGIIAWKAMFAGMAFLVAFALAFWVRSISRKGAMILAAVGVGAVAVSYVAGVNIDLSSVQENYDSAAGWVTWQARALLGVLTSNPSGAAAAVAGGWMGLRRPRQ